MRNQPINEITAMMIGSQATIPQFQPFQGSPIQGVEYRASTSPTTTRPKAKRRRRPTRASSA